MYWITGGIGVLLLIAPFIIGYSDNTLALWTSLLVGGATLIISWIEGTGEKAEKWEYWTVLILGLIAVSAPFILGFSTLATAMWSTVVAGILIAVFAGSELTSGGWT